MPTQTPGQTSPTPPVAPSVEAATRQLRTFKRLALFLFLVLLGGAAGFLYVRHMGQPVTVLLDGKPIASVRNTAAAEALLTQAEQAKLGGAYPEDSIVRLQKVQLQHIAGSAPLDPENVARAKLARALRLNVHAYAILVNDHVSLGLPSDAAASETLHRVKEHFTQMPPDAQVLGEPEFTERVSVEPRAVSGSLARPSAEAAAPYYWTPPPSRHYTVRRGDTGLVIARRHHLSLSQFIAANPSHDINRLTPGDVVNVQKMPLLLTVRVSKQFTRDEKVLANVPDSEAGLQRVTYQVTYLNGQETHREPIGIVTVESPKARTSL